MGRLRYKEVKTRLEGEGVDLSVIMQVLIERKRWNGKITEVITNANIQTSSIRPH